MGINREAATQLVSWVFPMMCAWFFLGAVIVFLYHLSLYTFDAEFRLGRERTLDLAVSVLRGLLYFVAWPAIFYFDRTALSRIRLYLRYLSPRLRATDPDVIDALKERDYRVWARTTYLARADLEDRRARELKTREQRNRRRVSLHEDSPLLDRYWLLLGIGTHWMGVEEMVRTASDYLLPEEVEDGVRRELAVRHQRRCPRCGESLAAGSVAVPGVEYLRVLEPGTDRMIIEGWAIAGDFALKFEPCEKCGIQLEPVTGGLAAFGRVRELVSAAKAGRSMHYDLP